MSQEPLPFAAFIGIDWADKKHDVCLHVPGQKKRERSVLEHRPTAIREWAQKLRERFGGAPVAVALELAQGPVVSALLEHDIFVLFPVQPTLLAKYREAFTPSHAKDDPTDAEFALELLLRYPERLPRLQPESADMRRLRRMVELRRALVDDRVAITNRLTSALKGYFPQILGWFRDKDTPVFAAFLERWPTLDAAKRARQETLVTFFRSHNVRSQSTIARRLDAIQSEEPLTTDSAVISPLLLLVETTIPQLRAVNAAIERFDAEIASLCPQLPDYELFDSLPGTGPALAPRLLVAFGERRERFIEWVGQTVPRSFWAKAFYQSYRERGGSHQLRFVLSPSSGSVSCIGAGSTANPTTKLATSWLSRNAMLRCSPLLRRLRTRTSLFPSGPPQGLS